MKTQIIQKIFNVKSSTLDDLKSLLHEIKSYKDEKLFQRIQQLEKELKEIQKAKKYWLVWEEKEEIFDKETIGKLPILEEIKTRNISQDNSENNILIQWDNYHTLSVLNYTHAWKIDVIYIDPPYNTWNNDFIYNDKIVDKEDKFRHSKWLSFINKRLKLAKNLLSEKWIIFISIDDNEFAQLKMLCDEIFWSENFIWNFVINSTPNARDYGHIWKMHEYCLFYSKNYFKIETNLLEEKEKKFAYQDNTWGFNIHPLYNSNEAFTNINRPNLFYPFYINTEKKDENWFYEISLENNPNYIEIYPPKSVKNNIQFVWRWWKEKALENLNIEIVWYKISDWEFRIIQKMRHSSKLIRSLLTDTSFSSRKWTSELEDIFQSKIFTFPKPLTLIKNFIKISSQQNSTILDFFAGSWTTGHAVLELNKEDWWNRKFILATNNENNICEEVTYERVKRVMTWYTNQKWEQVEWLWWNLTYLKTAFIDKSNVNDDLRTRMVARCSELLCLKENIWEEINQTNEKIKIFKRHDKYLAILYDMFYFDEFKEKLKTLEKSISVYAFSHYKLIKSDFDEIENIEIEQIPDPILEVYESIFWL